MMIRPINVLNRNKTYRANNNSNQKQIKCDIPFEGLSLPKISKRQGTAKAIAIAAVALASVITSCVIPTGHEKFKKTDTTGISTPGSTDTPGETGNPPSNTDNPTGTGTPTGTNTPTGTTDPTETTDPTGTTDPSNPIDPVVTQSPIQAGMATLVKALNLSSSTKDIKGFNYYNENDNAHISLNLKEAESTDEALVYAGTSIEQKNKKTNTYNIKYIIKQTTDGGTIISIYKESENNGSSNADKWKNYSNYKYILNPATGYIEKYQLTPEGSEKKLLETIKPDSPTSLSVIDKQGNTHKISGISITTDI